MSPDLAIPASPAALRNEGSGFLPLTAKAASFSGIGYASGSGVTLCMGQYQGGFALCTVTGAEILDQNFQRIDPLVVEGPTQAYVRMSAAGQDQTLTVEVSTLDSTGEPISTGVPVVLSRMGVSSTYLGPLTFAPKGYVPARAQNNATATASQGGPLLFADYITSLANVIKGTATLASRSLSLAADLKIEFLTETERPSEIFQITRIVDLPFPGVLARRLYAEETLIRVVAMKDGSIAKKADGVIRLDELPNTDFPSFTPPESITNNWQFSYQKDPQDLGSAGVATDLRPTRPNPSAFTAIPLKKGVTDPIRLRSLAGPRQETSSGELYEQTWRAKIAACQAFNSTPCGSTPPGPVSLKTDTEEIDQWVDQQAFSRHGPFGAFEATNGVNGVRDWLEAIAWDALSDATAREPVVAAATSCIAIVAEQIGKPEASGYAITLSTLPQKTTWYPQTFNWDEMRWDRDMCGSHFGLTVFEQKVLSSASLHEARHCWQFSWSSAEDVDGDKLAAVPELVDSHALRLKDDRHYWVGGGNQENHFRGDGLGLSDLDPIHFDPNSIGRFALERDAHSFEHRATAATATDTTVSGALVGVSVQPSMGEVLIERGTTSSSAVAITVLGRDGACWEATTRAVPGTVVELEVVPTSGQTAAGLLVEPQNTAFGYANSYGKYVAVSGADGVARLDLTGNDVGSYTIRIWLRQIVPDGDTPGAVLGAMPGGESAVVTVRVTP